MPVLALSPENNLKIPVCNIHNKKTLPSIFRLKKSANILVVETFKFIFIDRFYLITYSSTPLKY